MRKDSNPKAERDEFCAILQAFAYGRPTQRGGKPISGTEVQQIARKVLVRYGIDWAPSLCDAQAAKRREQAERMSAKLNRMLARRKP